MAVGGGFLDVTAGVRGIGTAVEGFAHAEAGWHFKQGAAFAFGDASVVPGLPATWQAGIGARLRF